MAESIFLAMIARIARLMSRPCVSQDPESEREARL